ncbi:5-oxoprolinase subunit PxpA [Mesonia aestuariivivens]|uniref:5-oxoprolinase subunit PxpA n=1 Tax=Mesonia aestuariivivens TaxID=2796128 RepID=A0ABS6W4T5_9FLAO|nr:5-oxoprolinase subunit PxpA [Mesonia aestuariivivens]MBW2962501.1 5-oxoprolinase subunit PxpA [Mesonia aestuariivivens]
MNRIDLNCDLAEGGAFDAALMPLISSCNIACGGHFGTKATITKAVELALENKVNIGAHPSYLDQENFGRKTMNISLEALENTLRDQILQVKSITERLGGKLHHVKPHGALYNEIVKDVEKANLVIKMVKEIDEELILFVPPNSAVESLAKAKLNTWKEGFADRNYEADFSLVSRLKNNAILHDKSSVFNHVFLMVSEGKIQLQNKKFLEAKFDTICVHSDTQNSVEILRYLRENLERKNIKIA